MGTYLFRSNLNEAQKGINAYFQSQDLKIVRCKSRISDENHISLSAGGEIENINVRISSEIFPYGDHSFARLNVSPSTTIQIYSGFKAALFLVFTLLIILSEPISTLSFSFKLKDLVLLGLFYLFAFGYLREISIYGPKLRRIEASFLAFIKNRYSVSLVSPVEAWIYPLWYSIVINFGGWLCVISLCFIAMKGMLIVITAFAVLSLIHLCLRIIIQNNLALWWKLVFVEMNYRWHMIGIYVLIFVGFLYAYNAAIVANYLKAEKHLEYNMKGALETFYFAPAFERQTRNLPRENADIMKKMAEKGAAKDIGHEETSYKISMAAGALLFFIAILVFTWIVLKKIKDVLSIPEYWKTIIAEEKTGSIRQPPGIIQEARNKILTRALISLDYVAALPINLFAAVVGIDAVFYAITDKTIIIEKAAILFSWIPANVILLNDTFSLNRFISLDKMIFLSKVVFILMALPMVVIVGMKLVKMIINVMRNAFDSIFTLAFRRPETIWLKEIAGNIAGKYGLKKPRIKIRKSKRISISVKGGLFSGKPILSISNATLGELDEREIAAVVAHEIGHVKQGYRRIHVAKILSGISLFPNSFLTLMFDYAKMEYDADRMCLEITRDKEALKNALLKISAFNSMAEKGKEKTPLYDKISQKEPVKGIREKLRNLTFAAEYMFGDGLIGYSHPNIMQRIKNIDSL